MQGLYFVYFYNTYCYIFLIANPNYISVYMKVYYLFTLCFFLKLADCFLSSLSLNICLSSLLSSVKRRHILCTGEHG